MIERALITNPGKRRVCPGVYDVSQTEPPPKEMAMVGVAKRDGLERARRVSTGLWTLIGSDDDKPVFLSRERRGKRNVGRTGVPITLHS